MPVLYSVARKKNFRARSWPETLAFVSILPIVPIAPPSGWLAAHHLENAVASIVRSALVQHARRLYGYALSLTGNPDTAAELFQDCALRALSAKRIPIQAPACRAWLFAILRNLWHDSLRHEQAASRAFLNAYPELPTTLPEQQYIDAIAVRAAMAQISPTLRETLALVDVAGFRYAEAAQILGIPIGTVMSRMSEARRKMAAFIAQENSNVVEHPTARKQRA